MTEPTQHSIAMITAWLTASVGLMDAALPDSPTVTRLRGYVGKNNASINGVISDYDALRDVALELSLLCATAISCWARNMGLEPEDVLRDIAVAQSTLAHDTD